MSLFESAALKSAFVPPQPALVNDDDASAQINGALAHRLTSAEEVTDMFKDVQLLQR